MDAPLDSRSVEQALGEAGCLLGAVGGREELQLGGFLEDEIEAKRK